MEDKIFYIDTMNANKQILVFDKYENAVHWCQKATNWDDATINERIKIGYRTPDGYYSVFGIALM